eukprot:TRINITY_DN32356_c0_g1_i1.p1 TRINITY_DN32356_c0_g1~~TRINITY_DN32356_c0_g1_i1.p1  ORF type:complete len:407 (+),score=123.82 TRINITY_DN32356_c0_g1_i1:101-1222(+)
MAGAAAASLALLSAAGTPVLKSAGCGRVSMLGTQVKHQMSMPDPAAPNGTAERFFLLRLPRHYDNTKPASLVLSLHGYYDYPRDELKMDHLVDYVDQHNLNYVVVYPGGSGIENDDGGDSRSWNIDGNGLDEGAGPKGPVCVTPRPKGEKYACYNSCRRLGKTCHAKKGCNCASCLDDNRFIQLLIDLLEQELCIDLDRVHVTGLSVGAMMVYNVALDNPARIASIAPAAGSRFVGYNRPPAVPMSLLEMHGHWDKTIPANVSVENGAVAGGPGPFGSVRSTDAFFYVPSPNVTAEWARAGRCRFDANLPYPTPFDGTAGFTCNRPYGECASGAEIVQCVGNWGHTWPLHYTLPMAYPQMVIEFFRSHPRLSQ